MRNSRKGFTLIELLVVIAIIAILAAVLFPVFAKARSAAKTSACSSNLKQLATAVMMYTQEYDTRYPGTWIFKAKNGRGEQMGHPLWLVKDFAKSKDVFICPMDDPDDRTTTFIEATAVTDSNLKCGTSYMYNAHLCPDGKVAVKVDKVQDPSRTMLINEGTYPMGWIYYSDYQPWLDGKRHGTGSNVACADGHVSYMQPSSYARMQNTSDVNKDLAFTPLPQ